MFALASHKEINLSHDLVCTRACDPCLLVENVMAGLAEALEAMRAPPDPTQFQPDGLRVRLKAPGAKLGRPRTMEETQRRPAWPAATRNKRKCSKCHLAGHDKRTCGNVEVASKKKRPNAVASASTRVDAAEAAAVAAATVKMEPVVRRSKRQRHGPGAKGGASSAPPKKPRCEESELAGRWRAVGVRRPPAPGVGGHEYEPAPPMPEDFQACTLSECWSHWHSMDLPGIRVNDRTLTLTIERPKLNAKGESYDMPARRGGMSTIVLDSQDVGRLLTPGLMINQVTAINIQRLI